MYAFVEGEDGVADGRVVGQAEVFLRGTRRRGRMTMPIGENFQTFASRVLEGGELILRGKREVLRRVINVLHPEVLGHHVAVLTACAQQIATRFIRCVLPGLCYQLINYNLRYFHHLVVFEITCSLFVIYQVVDGGIGTTDGARVTMLHSDGAELHGLGIEGKQTVRQ